MNADQIRSTLAKVLEAQRPAPDAEAPEAEVVTVDDVHVEGSAVTVLLHFQGVGRQRRHTIEDAVCSALEALEGIDDVTLEVDVDDLPETPPASAPPQRGQGPAAERSPIPGVRNIIAVASGKGGVGKSTVAVNLALALGQQGAAVGLLDIDIYGPSAPLLLGIVGARPSVSPDERRFLPIESHGLRVMSIGFLVEDDAPVIWRGPIVASVVKQFLGDVDWGELDYLVIDLPPGTGDAQLTLTQTVPITGTIIVTTPSELALVDAVKGLQMFRKVDTPVIGIVENMSHYVCPSCGHESQPFNVAGGTDRVAAECDVPVLGRIPLDLDIQRGGDEGKPITATQPESPQAQAFAAIARAVVERCPFDPVAGEKQAGGFLSSLFRR